jgi:hypothetical protein
MKLFMTFALSLGLQYTASADTSATKKAKPMRLYNNEVYADINTKIDGVDFNSWESDFNQSLENQQKQCKGKNCQFKNKQAFDPSWDL